MNKELLKVALVNAEVKRLSIQHLRLSLAQFGYDTESVTYEKVNNIYQKARRDVNDLKNFIK
jgi:hypothetical protein